MNAQVVLVDINEDVVDAWRVAFADNPEVTIVHGSMLEQDVDAWVTPTNAKGAMDGGLDYAIRDELGRHIETKVQTEIQSLYQGHMPVGCATSVETGREKPGFLISTPTMSASAEDISGTQNVAFACAAAFQAVHIQNRQRPGSIRSLALPGLGAQTGKVPVDICARLMWSGYHLFRRGRFRSFEEMRKMLDSKLNNRDPKAFKQKLTYVEGPLLTSLEGPVTHG